MVGALMTSCNLRGVDLSDADLSHAVLHEAVYDSTTIRPTGFDPRQYGAVLEE